MVTALTISGQKTRRFCFEAFLPYDKKERGQVLEELARETRTIIVYEAPHKLKKTLQDLYDALGNRSISLCRELTKKHEENHRTTLEEAIAFYEEREPRGEFVLVIEGADREQLRAEEMHDILSLSIPEHVELYMKQGMDKKDAMKAAAKDRGVGKREIYQALLEE
jgi:16S rRNA (cytidine1402-2'-O)-methyltransferase